MPDGFEFWADTNQPVSQYLEYIQKSTGTACFDFELKTSNQHFYLISDLPFDWAGTLLYESNNQANEESNGNTILKPAFVSSFSDGLVALVKLYWSDLISVRETSLAPVFTIAFNSRPVQWNYFIINRSPSELKNPGIVGKSEMTFSSEGEVILENGVKAIHFKSEGSAVPLSEFYPWKLDLINQFTSEIKNENGDAKVSSRTIFKSLPVPDPGRISIERAFPEGQAKASMYVYV